MRYSGYLERKGIKLVIKVRRGCGDYRQQGAEKALKALYDVWCTLSPVGTLKALKEYGLSIPKYLERPARLPDTYYILTRYPDGWPAGKPSEYYTEEELKEALYACENIHRFCETLLSGQGKNPERTQ